MITALAFMGVLGFVTAVSLGIFSRIFYLYEDPRNLLVERALAGANCGGCGFAGCAACAGAIVKGQAPVNACVVGGPAAAREVGRILGLQVSEVEPRFSEHFCRGGIRAELKYQYQGVPDCRAALMFFDGFQECENACLGFGNCLRVCNFGAVEMGKDGIPKFYSSRCVACGKCVRACPRNLIRLVSVSERLMDFRRNNECLAPCQQTCPAQIDVQEYIEQIRAGNYREALHTIKERNPLPLSCGRVCPHPCETNCRRAKVEEAVDINRLKRFVADLEFASGARYPVSLAPETGKRVAIVGGGPAGLTAAYFLRRLGHSPKILEMMPKLGGMLRYGIPEYRYPKQVLDWEIEGILKLGVEVRTELRLGRDFSIESLRAEGFGAVLLGIGAWESTRMGAEGENLPGVYGGIEFLIRTASGKPPALGKMVVVVGGGNTAVDAARTAVRMGSEATILYRRTRKEMPANAVEIEEAREEGVRINFLAAPTRLWAGADGKVSRMECIEMELGEPDASGRRRPVPRKGSEKVIEVDNVIAAVGQQTDMTCTELGTAVREVGRTRGKTFPADPRTLQTKVSDVFVAGDAFTGPDLVVSAIGSGRRAARSIHLFLSGKEVSPPAEELLNPRPETLAVEVCGVERMPRVKARQLDPSERVMTFEEVSLGITEEEARREADRCLRCGLYCYDRILKEIPRVVWFPSRLGG